MSPSAGTISDFSAELRCTVGEEPRFARTQSLGIDMVHFGVVVVVNIMLGLITPPYGTDAPRALGRILYERIPIGADS